MAFKRILTALTITLLLSAAISAQEPTGSTGTGLTVRSEPSGALVTLKGEATVTGITPTTFHYPLMGKYTVEVSMHGYETYSSEVVLDPNRSMQLEVSLSPKTRWKAAARSLFIPGWGQKYSDQNGKAFLFAFMTVGAGAAYLIADHNFDIDRDQFDTHAETYDSLLNTNATPDQLRRQFDLLADAREEAYDSENVRRVVLGAGIGIWALNVLDALFLTPEHRGIVTVQGISLEPSASSSGIRLTLTRSF